MSRPVRPFSNKVSSKMIKVPKENESSSFLPSINDMKNKEAEMYNFIKNPKKRDSNAETF